MNEMDYKIAGPVVRLQESEGISGRVSTLSLLVLGFSIGLALKYPSPRTEEELAHNKVPMCMAEWL